MRRHAAFDVPPQPRSVPSARDFCRSTLTGWGLGPMLDETQIVLSEVVTKGVLHARIPLWVKISAEAENLEIAVSDGSPAAPTVRSRRDDLSGDLDALNFSGLAGVVTDDRDPRLDVGAAGSVVGGRGMQLAAERGVNRSSSGKSVWARLPTPPARPPTAGCRCAAGDVHLASGGTVAAS